MVSKTLTEYLWVSKFWSRERKEKKKNPQPKSTHTFKSTLAYTHMCQKNIAHSFVMLKQQQMQTEPWIDKHVVDYEICADYWSKSPYRHYSLHRHTGKVHHIFLLHNTMVSFLLTRYTSGHLLQINISTVKRTTEFLPLPPPIPSLDNVLAASVFLTSLFSRPAMDLPCYILQQLCLSLSSL